MATRTLPPRPDLEHLRKEAKQLYIRLKRQAPQAQLADAQFILAAEYGFKSWGRLKSEVEKRNKARWAARLAAQESFRPAMPALAPAVPSQWQVWLGRQQALTEDEEPPLTLAFAWLHIGFILLALLAILGMTVR